MADRVVLPQLDRLMTEGTIIEFPRKPNEEVKKGDVIALIETEKVTVELNAPSAGIFHPVVAAGTRLKVGNTVAYILAPGEPIPERPAEPTPKHVGTSNVAIMPHAPTTIVPATPSARRMAREFGVDLKLIKGIGPVGRIQEEDVRAYIEASKIGSIGEETIPLTGWRKTMADRLSQSAKTVARVTTVAEIDATELTVLRTSLKDSGRYQGVRLTFTAFFVKATAKALKQFPILNSSLLNDEITLHKDANVGFAVAIEGGGLVVPVIRNADTKDLKEISLELEDLSKKAKEHRLTLQDVSAGTFTITNPGMMGVLFDTPLVNPPEVGILGLGLISKRPRVIGNQVVVREMLYASLSYDHRVVEGSLAVNFLQQVKSYIENPRTFLPDADLDWPATENR